MIDYKKYIKVYNVIKELTKDNSTPTAEEISSAICDLFDEQSNENIEVDTTTDTFQSFWYPKRATCNNLDDLTAVQC